MQAADYSLGRTYVERMLVTLLRDYPTVEPAEQFLDLSEKGTDNNLNSTSLWANNGLAE